MKTKRKIELLEKLLNKSKEITTESSSNPIFKSWKDLVERTFAKIFGENSVEVNQFRKLRFFYGGIRVSGTDYSGSHRNAYRRSFDTTIQSINNFIEELKEDLGYEESIDESLINTDVDSEINKIFISHSSKDKGVVEELIEILESIGLNSTQIFCSSFEGYGIEFGENFLDRIKEELDNNILVIFLLSKNFFESPICLCEMGATWVKTNQHIPILIPPFGFKDVKGVIPLSQGFKINDGAALNQFKVQIEKTLQIDSILKFSTWERKRDRIIGRIEKLL